MERCVAWCNETLCLALLCPGKSKNYYNFLLNERHKSEQRPSTLNNPRGVYSWVFSSCLTVTLVSLFFIVLILLSAHYPSLFCALLLVEFFQFIFSCRFIKFDLGRHERVYLIKVSRRIQLCNKYRQICVDYAIKIDWTLRSVSTKIKQSAVQTFHKSRAENCAIANV